MGKFKGIFGAGLGAIPYTYMYTVHDILPRTFMN